MLSPNTAQPGRSIWDHVDRSMFEGELGSLHRTRFVPESQSLQEEDWPEPRKQEMLPFAIEKQLSDDIAFVSAYDYGVRYVTAATVQVAERGVLIRLAANEGVCARVNIAWQNMFSRARGMC
jgi:hypothetical protein